MGSTFAKETREFSSQSKKTQLGDLPEGCVAMVLMNLEPKDICAVAGLSRAFSSASSADFVWESKLPGNYKQILDKIYGDDGDGDGDGDGDFPVGFCKKEIYSTLCRFNSIDHGTKKVWLDKSTGGMCMAISSKDLSINGIDDRRYWNHIPTEESRFTTVAYLQHIWWFEVNGEVDFPFPEGSYSVFFRLQLGRPMKRFGRRVCNTDEIHGWDLKPVQFQLSTSDNHRSVSQCFLEGPGKWLHYHAGDFVVEGSKGGSTTQLKFSMTQIDCTHTKGGLCLDSVVICPSAFKERLRRF